MANFKEVLEQNMTLKEYLKDKSIKVISKKPTLENLEKVKLEIDKILETNNLSGRYFEEGSGRTAVEINGFIVKLPNHNENLTCCGYSQNLKEAEVYFSTKHECLNPVFTTYKGCLICKLLLNSHDVDNLIDNFDLDYEILESIRLKTFSKLENIIKQFNLHLGDIKQYRQWGIDTETLEYRCLDYGLSNEFKLKNNGGLNNDK